MSRHHDLDGEKAPETRLWDFAAGLPNILFCVFGGAGFLILFSDQINGPWNFDHAIRASSQVSGALFCFLQALIVCIRRLPLRKAPGLYPRTVAVIAANLLMILALMPKQGTTTTPERFSSLFVLIGTAGSAITLLHLGKAFSILPQARILVTTGPYRIVRHPLYLFEQLSCLGFALHYSFLVAAPLLVVSIAMQFPRMTLEERVLLQQFPDYQAYQQRVPAINPAGFSLATRGRRPTLGELALTAPVLLLIVIAVLSWIGIDVMNGETLFS